MWPQSLREQLIFMVPSLYPVETAGQGLALTGMNRLSSSSSRLQLRQFKTDYISTVGRDMSPTSGHCMDGNPGGCNSKDFEQRPVNHFPNEGVPSTDRKESFVAHLFIPLY
jgi:hypothetical protein